MSFDLYNKINDDDKFILYDKNEKKKYWFQTDTLVKLINQSLTNSDNIMEINSKKPSNPYNRKDFSKFELNKIYKYLINKNKLPILLHLYKLSNYNIENFIYVNRMFLDDYIIKNIDDELKDDLINYFEQLCNENNINFTKFNIISEKFDELKEKLKYLIRKAYHSKFRNKSIKKVIEIFIKEEVYKYQQEYNIELIDDNTELIDINSELNVNNNNQEIIEIINQTIDLLSNQNENIISHLDDEINIFQHLYNEDMNDTIIIIEDKLKNFDYKIICKNNSLYIYKNNERKEILNVDDDDEMKEFCREMSNMRINDEIEICEEEV